MSQSSGPPPAVVPLRLDEIRARPAKEADRARGVMAFVSFVVSGFLRVDGVTVCRSPRGRLFLTYPRNWDQYGIKHFFVTPHNRAARREIERQVLAQLALERQVAP